MTRHNSVVSGYPTSTSFSWIDGWSTDPRVLGRHKDSIHKSIPEIENAKEFFNVVGNKYTKFPKNEKNKLLNILHSTFHDGISGVR